MVSVARKLFEQGLEAHFPDGLTEHVVVGLVDEVVSLIECDLEATNNGGFSEANPIKRSFVNFITNIISSLLHKNDLKTFVHFISNDLAFFKPSHFKNAHHLEHELVVVFVVECVVWKLKIPSLTVHIFLIGSHSFGIIFALFAKVFLHDHLKTCYF